MRRSELKIPNSTQTTTPPSVNIKSFSEGEKSVPSAQPAVDSESSTPVEAPKDELLIDARLQKIRDTSGPMSAPMTLAKPTSSSMGVNIELLNSELTKKFGARAVRRIGNHLESLLLLITGLRYDTQFEAIVTRCLLFLSGILDDGIVMGIQDILMTYIKGIDKSTLATETANAAQVEKTCNTPEASAAEIWQALKQGVFTKHLSYVMGTVFALATCKLSNVTFNHPIYDNMMKASEATTFDAIDMVDHLCKLYNWCSTVGLACFQKRSLEPLKFNSETLAVCHERYYFWQNRFPEIKREQNPDSAERNKMQIEMQEVITNLQEFVKYDRDKFMSTMSSTLLRDATKLYQEIRDYTSQVDFVKAAFGIHIWGLPKVGKSTIGALISEQVCLSGGEIYDPKRTAHLNLSSQFQDEISNSTQTLFMNETIPVKEHLAKSAEVAYTTALAVVDNVPWHPNRSNLEDKARILLRILLALSTGNVENPWVNIARSVSAWLRRYMLLEMTVKPQFSDIYGRLDSSLVDGSNDYHLFHFYEMVIHEDGTKTRDTFVVNGVVCKGINTAQMLEAVRVVSLKHFKSQERMEALRKTDAAPGCLICRRLAQFCTCKKGVPESTDPEPMTIQIQSEVVVEDNGEEDDEEDDGKLGPAKRENHSYRKNFSRWSRRPKKKTVIRSRRNQPEAGLAVMALNSLTSVAWDLVSVWLNPFVKFGHLWSIDKSTTNLIREELLQELEWVPDKIGTTSLSLIPQTWCERGDGSLTFLGKIKDRYARAIAAEKQIFLPLTYLFKRAFTFGFLTFFIMWLLQYIAIQSVGPQVLTYLQPTTTLIQRSGWSWEPFFPNYSNANMFGKAVYVDPWWGTRILESDVDLIMDWKTSLWLMPTSWVINHLLLPHITFAFSSEDMEFLGPEVHPLYRAQFLLGKLHYYWFITKTVEIKTFKVITLEWWEVPLYLALVCFTFGFLSMWYRRAVGARKRYEEICMKIGPDNALQTDLYDRMKRHSCEYNSYIPTAIGIVGVLATALCLYNSMRQDNEPQAEIEPKRKSWNDWFSFGSYKSPTPFFSAGRTANENVNALRKNLAILKSSIASKVRVMRGMYMESCILLIPRHYFKPDMYKEEMAEYLDIELECGKYIHKARVYSSSLVRIADKDAVLAYIPKAPLVKSMAKNLLPSKTGTGKWKSVFIRKDGPDTFSNITVNSAYEDNVDCAGFSVGRGIKYATLENFSGMCGSPIVADRKDGAILGFHVAGSPGQSPAERYGYAQEITYDDYEAAKKILMAKVTSLNAPEACIQDTERYGIKRLVLDGALPAAKIFHDGTPLPNVQIVGHNPILQSSKSRVVPSLLSAAMTTYCGVPNCWKAPDMSKAWVDHNRALQANVEDVWAPPPEAIQWAVDDYLDPVIPALKDFKKGKPYMQVLTLDQAINGVPEANYMPGLNMKTVMGDPFHGSKDKFFKLIGHYPDGRAQYALSDEMMVEFTKMHDSFLTGQQYDIWSKTCLKDEVVKEDKEKVRIFFITQAVFSIIVRMYMLPICEFMSCNPLLTECMVGINCAGPDWAQMNEHIASMADDDLESDSDFGDYDLRRSMEVMCAMLKMNLKMCEALEYSEADLKVLEGIFHCLRNPLLNWNGTLLRLYLWTSGNSITVYGNSQENSLYMRISFFTNGMRKMTSAQFHELGPYRKNEALATFGDDNKGKSRKEARPLTCFSSKKWFFDSIGMKITDARKSASPPEFLPSEEIDFLKRKSVFHPALNTTVGALNKNSIYKMGHMSMKSPFMEMEDLAVQSYASMMYEAFLHGEEFHETLRSQLQQVAEETKISSPLLDVSYSDRVEEWKRKYSPTSSSL